MIKILVYSLLLFITDETITKFHMLFYVPTDDVNAVTSFFAIQFLLVCFATVILFTFLAKYIKSKPYFNVLITSIVAWLFSSALGYAMSSVLTFDLIILASYFISGSIGIKVGQKIFVSKQV